MGSSWWDPKPAWTINTDGDNDRRDEATKKEKEALDTRHKLPHPQLIYQALVAAPDHAMTPQDLYQWLAKNTIKVSRTS